MSTDWIEPVAGFELNREESIVTKEYQAEKLASLGLDAALFGDQVDPSFYIGNRYQRWDCERHIRRGKRQYAEQDCPASTGPPG